MRHIDIILCITIVAFVGIIGLAFVHSEKVSSNGNSTPITTSKESVTTQQPVPQNSQQPSQYQEQTSQYFQQATQYLQQITQWQQKAEQSQQQATQYKDQASEWQQEYQNSLQVKSCESTSRIINETYHWKFCDSKNNTYSWSMPMQIYDDNIKRSLPQGYVSLKFPNGTIVKELDYTQFVEPDFRNVIDSVYNNAGSDDKFIFEVWYIVSQMTAYSKDMTNSNLWPLEVFSDGGGDCKDLSILIASMIESSAHTKNWKIQLVYLDYYNPTEPKTINHMVVHVDTGTDSHYVEATAKTADGLNWLNGVNVSGWAFDVVH